MIVLQRYILGAKIRESNYCLVILHSSWKWPICSCFTYCYLSLPKAINYRWRNYTSVKFYDSTRTYNVNLLTAMPGALRHHPSSPNWHPRARSGGAVPLAAENWTEQSAGQLRHPWALAGRSVIFRKVCVYIYIHTLINIYIYIYSFMWGSANTLYIYIYMYVYLYIYNIYTYIYI